MNATPRPWTDSANRRPWIVKHISRQLYIETKDQNALTSFIADMQFPECSSEEERETTLANADLIVQAVNSYDAMKEALEELVRLFPQPANRQYAESRVLYDAVANAKAALALANGHS